MNNTAYFIAAAGVTIAAGHLAAQQTFASLPCSPSPTLGSAAIIDVANPKFFVEVLEVTGGGSTHVLHAAIPDSGARPNGGPESGPRRRVCEKVDAAVDRNSKILIRIDQAYLRETRFAGTFGVRGTLVTSSGSRAIEIPGYSVIGKADELAPISVGALNGLDAAVEEIGRENDTVSKAIAKVDARDSINRVRFDAAIEHFARIDSAVQTHLSNTQRSVEIWAAIFSDDSAKATTDSTKRALKAAQQILADNRTHIRVLQDSAKLMAESLAVARARPLQQYLTAVQGIFRERQHATIALQSLHNPANAAVVGVYATATHRMPEDVIKLASDADSVWKSFLARNIRRITDSDTLELLRSDVASLRATLGDLVGDFRVATSADTEKALAVSAMKDAEINVRAAGAEVGDQIVLTFIDSIAGQPNSTRSTDVRVNVREFGVVRRISDAVLLMNLPGLREGTAVEAAQKAVDAAAQGQALSYPINLRGGSAPGVTLGWSYLPRLDDVHALMPRWVRSIAAWLEPGFGVNAAVPSVAHKTITLTPGKPSTEEAKPPELTYTAGMIFTLFDSAVSWSTGRTLTGDQSRTYSALGISFLAATEKAKQLFKDLNK